MVITESLSSFEMVTYIGTRPRRNNCPIKMGDNNDWLVAPGPPLCCMVRAVLTRLHYCQCSVSIVHIHPQQALHELRANTFPVRLGTGVDSNNFSCWTLILWACVSLSPSLVLHTSTATLFPIHWDSIVHRSHKHQVTQVSIETYKISDPSDISPPTCLSSII